MSREQRSHNRNNRSRSHGLKPQRQSFLIFCEGATEVGYFSSFKKRAKLMRGGNALSIVEDAIAYKNAAQKTTDQYWVVLDKDNTTTWDFENAIQQASANGIGVAWSNQAFECWLILHYRDFRHACHRNNYEEMLKQFITWYDVGEKGEVQGRKLHQHTLHLVQTAIGNARKGFESFDHTLASSHKETSTKIYELVESILLNS